MWRVRWVLVNEVTNQPMHDRARRASAHLLVRGDVAVEQDLLATVVHS
jgi:hypothetical protein